LHARPRVQAGTKALVVHQVVETTGAQPRRDERRPARRPPHHVLLGHVAAGVVQADGQRLALAPRDGEDDVVVGHGARDALHLHALHAPELGPGVRVVAAHLVGAADDHVRRALDRDGQRAAPVYSGVAVVLPAVLAGPGVDAEQVGLAEVID